MRAATSACIDGSNSAYEPRPLTLARYIATSASRSRSSAVRSPPEATTTPMLQRIVIWRPGELERRVERGEDALRQGEHLLGQPDVLDEDRELVAAEAGDRVLGAEHRTEASAIAIEERIAGRVAEAVVDGLEPVEVEEQQADQPAGRRPAGEGVLQAILEQGAVGQPGQVVVERLDEQPLLERAARGDVGQRAGHADELAALVVERPGVDLDPDRRPVGAGEAELVAVLVHDARGDGLDEVGVILAVVGVDEVEDRAAEALGDGMTGELLPGSVEERPSALGVDPEDHLADVLDDRPVAGLAVAQRLAGAPVLVSRQLQPARWRYRNEPDKADDGGHRADAKRRRELGRQVRAGRRQLDHDRRGDADEQCGDQSDGEPAAGRNERAKADGHDRGRAEGRHRRRDRGRRPGRR